MLRIVRIGVYTVFGGALLIALLTWGSSFLTEEEGQKEGQAQPGDMEEEPEPSMSAAEEEMFAGFAEELEEDPVLVRGDEEEVFDEELRERIRLHTDRVMDPIHVVVGDFESPSHLVPMRVRAATDLGGTFFHLSWAGDLSASSVRGNRAIEVAEWSSEAEGMGYPPEELLRQSVQLYVHPDLEEMHHRGAAWDREHGGDSSEDLLADAILRGSVLLLAAAFLLGLLKTVWNRARTGL